MKNDEQYLFVLYINFNHLPWDVGVKGYENDGLSVIMNNLTRVLFVITDVCYQLRDMTTCFCICSKHTVNINSNTKKVTDKIKINTKIDIKVNIIQYFILNKHDVFSILIEVKL